MPFPIAPHIRLRLFFALPARKASELALGEMNSQLSAPGEIRVKKGIKGRMNDFPILTVFPGQASAFLIGAINSPPSGMTRPV